MVIAGSAKAGTSALAKHLGRHPEIVQGLSKEPRFFTHLGQKKWDGPGHDGFVASMITDIGDYTRNFPNLLPEGWALDASTDYLWCGETPHLLKAFSARCEVKVIVIVRDPVERAVSEYNHTLRHGWETLSFQSALEAEEQRVKQGWQPLFHHKRRSLIADDISRFRQVFKDDLLVIDYTELQDIQFVMEKICSFIGVRNVALQDFERVNVSIIPRNGFAKAVLRNESIKAASRVLVPKSVRQSVWAMLHSPSREVVTVSDEERQFFQTHIEDEIKRCVANGDIPTSHWTCLA